MSSDIGPWHGGRRGGAGGGTRFTPNFFTSPFSSDPWDNYGGGNEDVAALSHANVDWRETHEAHIFRVDLPGLSYHNLQKKHYLSLL